MPKMEMQSVKFELKQDPSFFLEKFIKISQLNKWTEEQKCLQLCLALPGECEQWFMSLSEKVKDDFELLTKTFLNRYSNNSRILNYNKFISSNQHGKEVNAYVEEIQGLGQKLGKTQQEILDQIVHGLDEEIKRLVLLKDVQDVDEVVRLAKLASTTNATINATTSIPPQHNIERQHDRHIRQQGPYTRDQHRRRQHTHRPRHNTRTTEECQHCGMYNHASFDCRHKGARCYVCNKKGHIARTHKSR